MTVWLFLSVPSAKSLAAESVLLPYLPALRSDQRDRNLLMQEYFNLGFGYTEILAFLCIVHGIRLSLRHLKRILCRNGLRRRRTSSYLHDVISAVEQELSHSGSLLGYRQMHQRITLDKITTRSSYSQFLLYLILTELVNALVISYEDDNTYQKVKIISGTLMATIRLSHLANGFCIHGAIDGYNRRIL